MAAKEPIVVEVKGKKHWCRNIGFSGKAEEKYNQNESDSNGIVKKYPHVVQTSVDHEILDETVSNPVSDVNNTTKCDTQTFESNNEDNIIFPDFEYEVRNYIHVYYWTEYLLLCFCEIF